MKTRLSQISVTALTLLIGMAIGFGCNESDKQQGAQAAAEDAQPKKVRRVGQVIELKPEKKDYYVKLHAETWPSVLDRICKSNIHNYSIYLSELEGKLYLFAYFEYTGDDWDADMKAIADDPEIQRWWKETDPCQVRLPGTPEGEQWLKIDEVFHTD